MGLEKKEVYLQDQRTYSWQREQEGEGKNPALPHTSQLEQEEIKGVDEDRGQEADYSSRLLDRLFF